MSIISEIAAMKYLASKSPTRYHYKTEDGLHILLELTTEHVYSTFKWESTWVRIHEAKLSTANSEAHSWDLHDQINKLYKEKFYKGIEL